MNKKIFTWVVSLLTLLVWSSAASAEYCTSAADKNSTSCIFKVGRITNNSQIIISYTRQGWTIMVAVFMDEFLMIDQDATAVPGKGRDIETLEYINTRRDMTHTGKMMEAVIYKVSEDFLRDLGTAKGKVRFYLAGSASKKDLEVEVSAGQFKDIDAYIDETKTELKALFEDE